MSEQDKTTSELLHAVQLLQAEINPAWKEWVDIVGINTNEPFKEGWQERVADPVNQQKESYIAGLRHAQSILMKMVTQLQEGREKELA
jgi:hypothetical protein